MPKYEAEELALGDRKYIDDLVVPGMLHGALRDVGPPARPGARDRRVAALALPGVRRDRHRRGRAGQTRVRGSSIPTGRCSSRSARRPATSATCCRRRRRHAQLARAAAAARRRRVRGARAGDLDPSEALVRRRAAPASGERPRRQCPVDVEDAPAATSTPRSKTSAHVVEGTWHTQFIEHAFLEPELPGGAARPHDPTATGTTARLLAGPGRLRRPPADRAVPRARRETTLRVTLVSCGGAFGGKEDLSMQAQTRAARAGAGRPVKLAHRSRSSRSASIPSGIRSPCTTPSAATTTAA